MSDETVFVTTRGTGSRADAYHTDRECPQLAQANVVAEKPRDIIDSNRRHCRVCAGEVRMGGGGNDLSTTLADAAPEDVGLSPLGERGDLR